MANKKVPKSSTFFCNICDYNTSRESQYTRHLSTDKHCSNVKWLTMTNNLEPKSAVFSCENCGKIYKHCSSLSKHKKTCFNKNIDDHNIAVVDPKAELNELMNLSDKDLILTLINENKDFKNIIIEQSKTLLEQNKTIQDLAQRVGNNNNVNSHNKTFNLQVFLNETCKDAINISDFVSNIKLSLQDLEAMGRVGYVEGISNIIINNLNNMNDYIRPIHCSDVKREVLYVKDDNRWIKETDDKPLLTRAIKMIANENSKNITLWRDMYPGCTDADSKKNNTYLKIVSNSMPGITKEECNKSICKIITNIAKEVVIDKA